MADMKKIVQAMIAAAKGYTDKRVDAASSEAKSLMEIMQEKITSTVQAEVQKAVDAIQLPEPKNGRDGRDGADGKSLALEDVAPLVEASVQKAVAAIEIPAPENGRDGRDGADGKDGASVTLSDIAPMLNAAVEKAVKEAVAAIEIPQPKDGRDGLDGKDALQIEILPIIDETKTYPRGTFAMHEGGLFRAYEKTDGLRGWDCVVEGIKALDIDMCGAREISIKIEKSSGETQEKTFSVPVMLYRGVFRDGESYQKGDTCTYAGSLWHCNKDTQEKPLTGASDWTLCAKRGRDANPQVKAGAQAKAGAA